MKKLSNLRLGHCVSKFESGFIFLGSALQQKVVEWDRDPKQLGLRIKLKVVASIIILHLKGPQLVERLQAKIRYE